MTVKKLDERTGYILTMGEFGIVVLAATRPTSRILDHGGVRVTLKTITTTCRCDKLASQS